MQACITVIYRKVSNTIHLLWAAVYSNYLTTSLNRPSLTFHVLIHILAGTCPGSRPRFNLRKMSMVYHCLQGDIISIIQTDVYLQIQIRPKVVVKSGRKNSLFLSAMLVMIQTLQRLNMQVTQTISCTRNVVEGFRSRSCKGMDEK